MIDLKKMKAKIDKMFETQTPESFNKWFVERRVKEYLKTTGVFQPEIIVDYQIQFNFQTDIQIFFYTKELRDNGNVKFESEGSGFFPAGNTSYAMAA
jgi:hypothetical protein